jgi:hypothetical protein
VLGWVRFRLRWVQIVGVRSARMPMRSPIPRLAPDSAPTTVLEGIGPPGGALIAVIAAIA